MTIASTGIAITWPVVAVFLLFDLALYAVFAWSRSRTMQHQRACYHDDYLGILQIVQDIYDVLTASLTEQEQINMTLRDTITETK